MAMITNFVNDSGTIKTGHRSNKDKTFLSNHGRDFGSAITEGALPAVLADIINRGRSRDMRPLSTTDGNWTASNDNGSPKLK